MPTLGSMRTRTTTCILFFVASVLACGSQGSSRERSTDRLPNTGDEPSRSDTEPSKPSSDGNPVSPDVGTAPSAIVFNEVLAVGSEEWIEIVNPGPDRLDLSNYWVADSSKQTNAPKRDDAMQFPTGTILDPGGRIVILTSQDGTTGPHAKAECLPDGPETCLFASFGVSATAGEALHFLGPDGSVIATTTVPVTASADAGGSTAESQCRLPDITGEFTRCALTPGLPNRAP